MQLKDMLTEENLNGNHSKEYISIVFDAIKFKEEELLTLLTKLSFRLDSDIHFFFSSENIPSLGDMLFLNAASFHSKKIESQYMLTSNKKLYELKYPFYISFAWLWDDVFPMGKELINSKLGVKISLQTFEDRPYIKEFIQYIVDYRLNHQEAINYDILIDMFVKEYKGKTLQKNCL